MTGMTLEKIAQACHGKYLGLEEYKEKEVSGVVIDSRQVEADFLYIPIVGKKVDGHSFIDDVFEKGALCTLSERELVDFEKPYILVNSTLQALKEIAAYYRIVTGVKVIGITGSVGKTSTKEMISAVLSEKYNVLKTEGNFNNEIGLPLTIFRIKPEHEIAVLEMGIDSFGEMHRLSEVAKPDICVITNIGDCHLENLRNRDGVLKAKTEIFDSMDKNGTVILNGDDEKLRTIIRVNGNSPVFYGINSNRSIHSSEIRPLGLTGTNVNLYAGEETINVTISIPGSHMVYNALAALAVGKDLGMTIEEVKRGIEKLKAVGGRNNVINTGCLTIIDDCYNANPVSMKSSLDVLSYAKGRKVAILGDMFELGADEIELHKSVGQYAAGKNIDVIIGVGKLAKYVVEEANKYNKKITVLYYETKDKLLQNIFNFLKIDDTVLVKASHGMEFTEVVDKLQNFKISDILLNQNTHNEIRVNIMETVNNMNAATREDYVGQPDTKKKNSNGSSLFFSVAAMLLICYYIFDALFISLKYDITLSYYFVLLAVVLVMILTAIYNDRFMHIIRGIALLILFEVIIVANMSTIKIMIEGFADFHTLREYMSAIWYLSLGGWLVIEGVKSIFIRSSQTVASISTLVGIINIVTGIINIYLLYDYYSNISTIFKVEMYRVYLMLSIYLVYIFLIISNLAMSWQSVKKAKKIQ